MPYTQEEQALLCQLGENIRRIRKKRGLSQEALAFQAALDRTYVGSVERGERNIALLNIVQIARALQVGIEELLKSIE